MQVLIGSAPSETEPHSAIVMPVVNTMEITPNTMMAISMLRSRTVLATALRWKRGGKIKQRGTQQNEPTMETCNLKSGLVNTLLRTDLITRQLRSKTYKLVQILSKEPKKDDIV